MAYLKRTDKVLQRVVFAAVAACIGAASCIGGIAKADANEQTADSDKPIHCLDGWERLLPGDYYACRATYHAQRNHPHQAFEMLMEAAYWANKDAQHALGLAYFNGDMNGVAVDQAKGIAWLALAAERKNPEYIRDYAVARSQASPAIVARAGEIYLQLKKTYGDTVAGLRATRRFIREVQPLDQAADGGGGVIIPGLTQYPVSAFLLARKVHAEADRAFDGLQGTVSVGTLQRVDDSRSRNVVTDPSHPIHDIP